MGAPLSSISLVLEGLLQPADALLDPGRRVFWPFLLCSAALGAAALAARGVPLRRVPRALLSPRLWLHRSARLDYQLIAVKAALRAALLGGRGASALAVAALSAGWLRRHLGAPGLSLPTAWLAALFTLAAFLVEDWSRFYVHRLMHRSPLLWELHKVHHSAEVLTPLTLYRTHPLEVLLNGARGALALGLCAGLFAWLFGPALRAWELLGVDAVGFAWTLLGANLRHSHVWLSYGRRLEHLLVSPAQHQIHHSRHPRHRDRNFGTVLALWDWLGGSLYVTGAREPLRFGVLGEAPPRRLGELLLSPLWAMARRLGDLAPRRQRPAVAALLALLLCGGCAGKRLDRAALLQSLGQCTVDRYAGFQRAADELAAATATYAAAPGAEGRAAARAAWERAMDRWQVVDLLRYGPAADFETRGGRGLRASIYAWPDVNRCLIEEQLVGLRYEGGGLGELSVSTRGLGALEYLLAFDGADNGCAPTSQINASGSWAALFAEERGRRKAAYAAAAAADLQARSRALLAAWEGGFLSQLAQAGRGSALFETQQEALSAVAEAVFYADTELKDRKLAAPLGLRGCAGDGCAALLESPFANRAARHLRDNLAGLRLLLEGCAAGGDLGFDDLLEAVGAPELAAGLRGDLAALEAALGALPGDGLAQTLAADRPAVQRAHDAVKELTDFLKMEFSLALAIRSQRVEGDHD